MGKYRKRPLIVEAIQWHGKSLADARDLLTKLGIDANPVLNHNASLMIYTLEGVMEGRVGDWIIKGVNGELYPCKPDIFEKTYEEITHND